MIDVVQLGRQRVCFANIRLKTRGFRRIDTSSNMANMDGGKKRWREPMQIGTAARNCYKSCSRRFAAIEFRTVREFHPLQGVNISQKICKFLAANPISYERTSGWSVSPRRLVGKKPSSPGKMDKLADKPSTEWPEWPLISQFGSTGWRCLLGLLVSWTSILSTCERARASKICGRKRVRNVCSSSNRGPWRPIEFNPEKGWCYLRSRDDRCQDI